MILLTNWKIPGMPNGFPIFDGSFEDFNADWYSEVGTTILLIMVANIIFPHLIAYIGFLFLSFQRWQDRRWTSDLNVTSKVL